MKTLDHLAMTIIIAVQFLVSLWMLVTTPWALLGSGTPGRLMSWLVYWGAGIATAVLLQKQRPIGEVAWRRIAGAAWYAVGVGLAVTGGGMKVSWYRPWLEYGMVAMAYLIATALVGFAAAGRVRT